MKVLVIVILGLLFGCSQKQQIVLNNEAMPVIEVSDFNNPQKKYVMLKLDYGIIINNQTDFKNGITDYYVFNRKQKNILKTQNINIFLQALAKIPDNSKIDSIDKCTIPFCSQYGVNIDIELEAFRKLVKRKHLKIINETNNDSLHAPMFCYCESNFKILETYISPIHLMNYDGK